MFTLKLYQHDKIRIVECHSVTVYRWENGAAQITAHGPEDAYDVGDPPHAVLNGQTIYDRAIIENSAGKTTEIVTANTGPGRPPSHQLDRRPVMAGDDFSARVA